MNLGIGLGGLAAGLIAQVNDPTTFTVLFVLDALTFLAYVGVLAFIHDPGVTPEEAGDGPASYATVIRHKTFLGLWTLNFLFVAAGYSLFALLPAFARDQADLSERQIGAVFFVNTLAIVLAQLPLSRWIEGRRRMRALVADAAPVGGRLAPRRRRRLLVHGAAAFLVISFAAVLLGIGECFHGPAHQALVSDIGPPHLRGRYFAVHSLSWGLAGTVGPAVGGFILAAAPFALWPLASLVCVIAALGVLWIERFIPRAVAANPERGRTHADACGGARLGRPCGSAGRGRRARMSPTSCQLAREHSVTMTPAEDFAPYRLGGRSPSAEHHALGRLGRLRVGQPQHPEGVAEPGERRRAAGSGARPGARCPSRRC